MRDKQVEIAGGDPHIPLVSGLLHCVAMSVIVFLRSSFGFAYLRPKSVFFAFSWALILFAIYAWNEPSVWRTYRATCLFSIGSIVAYWLHLLTSFIRELHREGEHDRYSGRSHPLAVLRWLGKQPTPTLEMNVHLWVEPSIILASALFVRYVFSEFRLSIWLIFAAACLCFKEAWNYWHQLRQQKRQEDIFADTADSVADTSPKAPNFEPPVAARKSRVKRQRATSEGTSTERRFAELLRLFPPYTLQMAEDHYRALIKTDHPDTNEGTIASNARSVDLNEAIEFFRERLRD